MAQTDQYLVDAKVLLLNLELNKTAAEILHIQRSIAFDIRKKHYIAMKEEKIVIKV